MIENFSYVGICKTCNKMQVVICDMPGREKITAKDVGVAIKRGLEVARVKDEEMKKMQICKCAKAKKGKKHD